MRVQQCPRLGDNLPALPNTTYSLVPDACEYDGGSSISWRSQDRCAMRSTVWRVEKDARSSRSSGKVRHSRVSRGMGEVGVA